MAKIRANGAHEVARWSRQTDQVLDLIVRELVEYLLRSDNVVLRRRVVWFRADGRRHDYGWKRVGKLKAGQTAADFEASLKGFTKVVS